MTVSQTNAPAAKAGKADPKAAPTEAKANRPEPQPEPETLSIELARIQRYFYGNRLYLKDEVYIFGREDAMHMFQLKDHAGLPVFTMARKRVRMVPVEVDAKSEATQLTKKEQRLSSVFNLVKDGAPVAAPEPVAKLDISDDDPEIAAKFAAADAEGAGEIDTAAGVAV